MSIHKRFYDLDELGVRAFVRYSSATGKWSIECYRKKTQEESEGDHDWKMIRVGHVHSYSTRKEAEIEAIKLAEQILSQYIT